MPHASGLQFTARVGDFAPDHFVVVGFTLTEALSELFLGRIDLASTDPRVTAESVLEQPVDLVVWQDSEPLRRFTGVINEFARGDSGHHRTRYEVVFQPALWRLGLMHNSRIFQGQATDAIVRTLLEERGIVDAVMDLKRQPSEREYCVQHRETDLAFVERLAAEEGWHYRYQHGDVDGDTAPGLIFADHHGNAPELSPVTYNARAGGSVRTPCVFRFEYRERVRAASVVLKDYTFRNPAYALMHERSGTTNSRHDYQYFDYPGRYKADASGQPFAAARRDALRNDACTARGESNRADFFPGARVALTDHEEERLNQDWLITAVTHSGHQPQALEEEGGSEPTRYHNFFNAIPSDRTWRPLCEHRPLMDGPQVAIVTGPEGEEIHCDQYGRVKVRFPWDRYAGNDENSSAWLRVSQAWAGGQYGFMALPRIGHEVIVSFLDGDPDQPIITGRTHHATNLSPYTLPEHKTRTVLKTRTHKGEGSNELRFEDEAGQEQVFVHAQKDLDLVTENNRTEVVRNDSHFTTGNHRFSEVGGDRHDTVKGEHRTRVGGDYSLIANGSLHSRLGESQLVEAGSEIHHQAGIKVVIEAGAEITLKAGGSFLKIDPGGVTISGPAIRINSGGAPGSGAGQAAREPQAPQSIHSDQPVSGASPDLAQTSTRDLAAPAGFVPPALSDERGKLLAEAAQQGALSLSECDYDEHGRCRLHQHS